MVEFSMAKRSPRAHVSCSFHALTIQCKHLDVSREFYERGLGCEPEDGGDFVFDNVGQWYRLGSILLQLWTADEGELPRGGLTLWLVSENLGATRAALQRVGAEFVEDHDEFFIVRDPDGLTVEVWDHEYMAMSTEERE